MLWPVFELWKVKIKKTKKHWDIPFCLKYKGLFPFGTSLWLQVPLQVQLLCLPMLLRYSFPWPGSGVLVKTQSSKMIVFYFIIDWSPAEAFVLFFLELASLLTLMPACTSLCIVTLLLKNLVNKWPWKSVRLLFPFPFTPFSFIASMWTLGTDWEKPLSYFETKPKEKKNHNLQLKSVHILYNRQ